ncbi:MAG TPA: hypothetical protein VNH64_10055 [Parvularculaceae bacterium]|nr:hypothetical protein [Parvularculaceae bacterium]
MRWTKEIIAVFAWFAATGAALCADLRVEVRDTNGAPVENAIVALLTDTKERPTHAPQTYTIDQISEEFVPFVTLLRPGDSLQFRNSDKVLHQVYSFAPINRFEFEVHPGKTSPTTTYKAAGIASIGCNIHDHMLAYAVVSAAPFVAKTDATGVAIIRDAPLGASQLSVWHPLSRVTGRTVMQEVDVAANADPVLVHLSLAPNRSHMPHGVTDY